MMRTVEEMSKLIDDVTIIGARMIHEEDLRRSGFEPEEAKKQTIRLIMKTIEYRRKKCT